jgi:hypothetical protein
VFLNYLCMRFSSISLDNQEYTLVPAKLFESPKAPSDEKCLRPTNRSIRPSVAGQLCFYFHRLNKFICLCGHDKQIAGPETMSDNEL